MDTYREQVEGLCKSMIRSIAEKSPFYHLMMTELKGKVDQNDFYITVDSRSYRFDLKEMVIYTFVSDGEAEVTERQLTEMMVQLQLAMIGHFKKKKDEAMKNLIGYLFKAVKVIIEDSLFPNYSARNKDIMELNGGIFEFVCGLETRVRLDTNTEKVSVQTKGGNFLPPETPDEIDAIMDMIIAIRDDFVEELNLYMIACTVISDPQVSKMLTPFIIIDGVVLYLKQRTGFIRIDTKSCKSQLVDSVTDYVVFSRELTPDEEDQVADVINYLYSTSISATKLLGDIGGVHFISRAFMGNFSLS